MYEYGYRVYEEIIRQTASELILFFVIVAVAMIPLYMLTLRGRKADRQHEREEKQLIIKVIQENSEVIAGLKAALDNSGATTGKALEQLAAGQQEIASKVNKVLLAVSGHKNN